MIRMIEEVERVNEEMVRWDVEDGDMNEEIMRAGSQDILDNGRKKAENALKKAEAAAAKLQKLTEISAEKLRYKELKAAAKLLKILKPKKQQLSEIKIKS